MTCCKEELLDNRSHLVSYPLPHTIPLIHELCLSRRNSDTTAGEITTLANGTTCPFPSYLLPLALHHAQDLNSVFRNSQQNGKTAGSG